MESFFKISVERSYFFKVPFAMCLENQKDFTHFTHLHRKAILDYRLIYKRGERAIFLYKARRLYPFPFYDTYIVFREFVDNGYYQIYLNTKTGAVHYLRGISKEHGELSSQKGEFVFSLPMYWKLCPSLFFWIFKKRMSRVVKEDVEWFEERMKFNINSKACAPVVPENYDLFEDLFKDGVLPKSDVHFVEDSKEFANFNLCT